MATLPVQKLSVVVSCQSCGATIPMRMTSTARSVDRRTLAIRLDVDRADQVMVRLFSQAHRGPFGHSR